MKKLGIIFGLSLYLTLSAENIKTTKAIVEEGMQYHQAKEYTKAIDLYKKALDQPIKSIDRDIIHYNLASSYLQNSQFDLAINGFKEVIENKERLPGYLYERACYNLILAHLKKVDSFVGQEWGVDSKPQAEQIKKHLSNAHLYYQFLIDYQNRNQMIADGQWIDKIRQTIKELNCKLDEKIKQIDLKNLTFISGLKSLEEHLKGELVCLETLLEKQFDNGFSKYFLEKTYAKEREKLPLWQRLDELYEKAVDQDENNQNAKQACLKEEKESFSQSYHHFLSALDLLKQGDAFQSHLLLNQSLLEIDLLIAGIQEQDVIEYGLIKREKKAAQLNHRVSVDLMRSLSEKEYGQVCHLISDLIQKWEKDGSIEEFQDKNIRSFISKELIKNLSNIEQHSPNICFRDLFLYQSHQKKLEELLLPLYSKLEIGETKLDSYELDRLQVIGQLIGYHQVVEEDDKNGLLLKEELASLGQVKNSLENQQLVEAFQHLEHLLINYHFLPFMMYKLKELSQGFDFLVDEAKIQQQHLDALNLEFEKVLRLEDQIKNPNQKRESFNEIKQGLAKSLENFSFVELKKDQETLDHLLIEDSLLKINRLIYDLSVTTLTETQRLWQGLCDQKHALKLAETYQNLDQPLAHTEEHLLGLAIASENDPLHDVKGLGAMIELKIMEAKQNKAELQNMLDHFKKGELAAEKAKQLLANSCIVWDEVITLEKQVIEHWTKALEALKQQSSNSNQDQKGNDQNQESSSQSSLAENQNSLEPSVASTEGEVKEGEESEDKKNQALLQLLEQLNEMQQDDQVVKPQNKTVKKGLRPW